MKICKVKNCNNKAVGQGYCYNHYTQFMNKGIIKIISKSKNVKNRKCSIEGCDKKHYAEGYCRSHYTKFKRTGDPNGKGNIINKGTKCLVEDCNKKATARGYCSAHYYHLHKYGDALKRGTNKGENNGNWHGGTSEYPDHYLLKKNRIIKLESVNYICEECGGKASQVYHKDHDKSNHDIDNLKALCVRCLHKGKHNCKYRNLYGMTLKEMSEKFNVSKGTILLRHKEGVLKECINEGIFDKVYLSKYKEKYGMSMNEISKVYNISRTTVGNYEREGKLEQYIKDHNIFNIQVG